MKKIIMLILLAIMMMSCLTAGVSVGTVGVHGGVGISF